MAQGPKKYPSWLKTPYDNSPAAQRRFHYIEKDRTTPLTNDNMTYAKAGALLETYVDALHLALVLGEPKFLHALQTAPQTIGDPSFYSNSHQNVPRFVREAIGDYRSATSFFRHDMVMEARGPYKQSNQPQPARFAQITHGQLRKIATDYGRKFDISFFPPSGQQGATSEDYRRFKAAEAVMSSLSVVQKEYNVCYNKFEKQHHVAHLQQSATQKDKESARITAARQQRDCFKAFLRSDAHADIEAKIEPLIEKLVMCLSPFNGKSGINKFYLKHKKTNTYLEINNNQKMDQDFSLNYPALMILSLGTKGTHDIDRTFASRQIFGLFSEVIGVESQITENLQKLHNTVLKPALHKAGIDVSDDPLFGQKARKEFMESIHENARGIQFIYTFHKALGQIERIYPEGKGNIAYRDMERLLAIDNIQVPIIGTINTPAELATLLYALERREYIADRPNKTLGILAQEIGKCRSFNRVNGKYRAPLLQALASLPCASEIPSVISLLANAAELMPEIPLRESADDRQR